MATWALSWLVAELYRGSGSFTRNASLDSLMIFTDEPASALPKESKTDSIGWS